MFGVLIFALRAPMAKFVNNYTNNAIYTKNSKVLCKMKALITIDNSYLFVMKACTMVH